MDEKVAPFFDLTHSGMTGWRRGRRDTENILKPIFGELDK